jgi:hypothetical protein
VAKPSVRDRLLHIERSIAAISGYWDGKTVSTARRQQEASPSHGFDIVDPQRIWSVVALSGYRSSALPHPPQKNAAQTMPGGRTTQQARLLAWCYFKGS